MAFKLVKNDIIRFLVFLIICSGCGFFTKKTSKGWKDIKNVYDPTPPPEDRRERIYEKFNLNYNLTVDYFGDCGELQENVKGQLLKKKQNDIDQEAYYEQMEKQYSRSGVMSDVSSVQTANTASEADYSQGGQASTPAPSKESFTNVQEKGVDEADFVKISTYHIFVLKNNDLEVVDRKSLKLLGKLTIDDVSINSLYVDDDRLIILGQSIQEASQVKVKVFLAQEGQIPELEGEQTLKGDLKDSRFIDGRLVLVFSPTELPLGSGLNTYSLVDVEIPDEPVIQSDDEHVSSVNCKLIAKPVAEDLDFRLTKVATINTRDMKEDPQLTIALGGGDDMYMTLTNLYLTKRSFQWQPWLPDGETFEIKESFVITKVHFDAETGQVGVAALGELPGRVKDQWAFKEYDKGILSVATSTGALWDHDGPNVAQNHLWILKQEEESLNVAAAVNDFGTGEDIRSVRYVNNTAYVVTFKKTDPLFAFDLTNPLEPKLLGELKVPGFSVYMHPVGPDRILGVGFDADDQGAFAWYQGLQVSLFDVSNPLDMKRIDNKIIGDRGSYSDVTSDHHAFFFDEETKLVSIPAVELDGKEFTGGWETGNNVAFSGSILYRVETDSLTEVARLTHKDLIPAECQAQLAQPQWWQNESVSLDINRVYKVDGKLLSISRFGIKTHLLDQLETSKTAVVFDNPQAMCEGPRYLNY